MRPFAICDTMPISTIGSNAITGLRKITSSSTRISSTVAMPTTASALPDASCTSSCCATVPVVAAFRSPPPSNACSSVRNCLADAVSCSALPDDSCGIFTAEIYTTLLGAGVGGEISSTSGRRFAVRPASTSPVFWVSAAVSGALSPR